ncbi:hypothetical protein R70723_12795 [Paenibacillus sp. FSL R7-0273]|uniref:hypothetical protein n=1 Tax=Paenibacillus sp. FSL R7-0273 TaxID=1536772 RepID=UPI0004F8D77E|nr:hypothetical protein [Paenibacillus sp. FSL R7-0273]AIQ46650.1 hypothetical protein R70723_12795 [Paenibacillus sp. FSL R7-0273]OMF97579.1 hypothetical protein BK144_02785 [Paenibacillus sp. FSL R7-0273]
MRSRNDNGRYRQKRGEALAGNLEKKYGSDVGVRSELTLEALKKQYDNPLAAQLMKEQQQKE